MSAAGLMRRHDTGEQVGGEGQVTETAEVNVWAGERELAADETSLF